MFRFHQDSISRFAVLTLALCALLAVPFTAQAQDCVDFEGLEHCSVNDAELILGEGLTVIPAKGGDSGVSVHFSEGVVWGSAVEIEENAKGATSVLATAASEGKITSTSTVRRDARGSLGFSATFTGASEGRTYSIQVYNDGVFQGGAGGIDDGAEYLYVDPRWDEDFIMWLIGHWSFHLRVADGGCGWEINLDETRALRLANGEVLEGDTIRFEEELRKGHGHYPYTGFDTIELLGSAPSITLESASVLP